MDLSERKNAFVKLGEKLKELIQCVNTAGKENTGFKRKLEMASQQNPWFTESHQLHAMGSLAKSLEKEKIDKWLDTYNIAFTHSRTERKIAVVLAGNVPAVGFHDFMCVLVSGHAFLGKLSSQDKVLLPMIAEILTEIEPRFRSKITFTEERLKNFDAVIATGSNNTARYFEYYFGKYPNIIRKNRSGIAILDGKESKEQLKALGKDVFLYFGLGCRNVSKLLVPAGYQFDEMLEAFREFSHAGEHHKYMNNYDYFKSIYLVNKEVFYDNGFLLIKHDQRISSPVSVLFFENYTQIGEARDYLKQHAEKIQCIVGDKKHREEINAELLAFGEGQSPELWDYADNVDTLRFLLKL